MRRPDPSRPGRRPVLVTGAALALTLAVAAPAAAETYCVGFARPGCVNDLTAAQAFGAAALDADPDRIELGDVRATAALGDAGRALEVVGAGEGVTVLEGGLTLSAPASTLTGATVHDLTLSGVATRVRVEGAAELHGDRALLRAALVRGSGGVDAVGGSPRLETVVVDQAGGPGLRVRCATVLAARHVSLLGTPAELVTTACSNSVARISDSILWGPAGAGFVGPGDVVTDHTDYRPVAGHAPGAGDLHADPGFVAPTAQLAPGSPLLDAGAPGALGGSEFPEDRDALPRVADGNADGVLARDLGAFELPPASVALPAGNLLADPSAEQGVGWAFGGGFTRERYGAFPFPSAAVGGALAAGDVFFAGGAAAAGEAAQVVGVTAVAPEIDLGAASASLSGLLGGFRSDADAGVLRATFVGPAGQPLGSVELAAPSAPERANASALLARARTDAIPPLTRSIVVAMEATRATGGYDDAYFDNLGLTVSAPGAPFPPRVPGGSPLKPFAGVRVLTGVVRVDRRGRVPVRLACVDGTVGRCSGAVTLVGALRKGGAAKRLATARVSIKAGAARRLRLPLTKAARTAVRKRRRVRMTLFAAVRDGQGVTSVSTVPLIVKWRR